MLSKSYRIYLQGNLSLASSVVLKSKTTIEMQQRLLSELGYPESADPTTWKYYLNLNGRYHSTNTLMTVISADTQNEILFDKDVLRYHPLTKLNYKPGTTNFKKLVSEFPEQEQLIRRILNPIDMQTAIEAEDHEILFYDESLVGSNERNLIKDLQTWVNHYTFRWHNESFTTSDLGYAPAFYAILYMMMVLEIGSIRLKYSRTPETSKWHLWTYLAGKKGLDRYREFLTTEQALFLHRNIESIMRNAGRDSTMSLLVNNIITPRNMELEVFKGFKTDENFIEDLRLKSKFSKSKFKSYRPLDEDVISSEDVIKRTFYRATENEQNFERDNEKMLTGLHNSNSYIDVTNLAEVNAVSKGLNIHGVTINTKVSYWGYLTVNGKYSNTLAIPIPGRSPMTMDSLEGFIMFLYASDRAVGNLPNLIPYVEMRDLFLINYPSFEEYEGVLDPKHVDIEGLKDFLLNNLLVTPYINGYGEFDEFCTKVSSTWYIFDQASFFAKTEHGLVMIENYLSGFTVNPKLNLKSEGMTYEAWFDELDFSPEGLSAADFLKIAHECLLQATGIDLEGNGLQSTQAALVKLLDELTSYKTMVIPGKSSSSPVPLISEEIKLFDNVDIAKQDNYLELANVGLPKSGLVPASRHDLTLTGLDILHKKKASITAYLNYDLDIIGSVSSGKKFYVDIPVTQAKDITLNTGEV